MNDINLDTVFSDIADSIRDKTKSPDSLKPTEFAESISSIPSSSEYGIVLDQDLFGIGNSQPTNGEFYWLKINAPSDTPVKYVTQNSYQTGLSYLDFNSTETNYKVDDAILFLGNKPMFSSTGYDFLYYSDGNGVKLGESYFENSRALCRFNNDSICTQSDILALTEDEPGQLQRACQLTRAKDDGTFYILTTKYNNSILSAYIIRGNINTKQLVKLGSVQLSTTGYTNIYYLALKTYNDTDVIYCVCCNGNDNIVTCNNINITSGNVTMTSNSLGNCKLYPDGDSNIIINGTKTYLPMFNESIGSSYYTPYLLELPNTYGGALNLITIPLLENNTVDIHKQGNNIYVVNRNDNTLNKYNFQTNSFNKILDVTTFSGYRGSYSNNHFLYDEDRHSFILFNTDNSAYIVAAGTNDNIYNISYNRYVDNVSYFYIDATQSYPKAEYNKNWYNYDSTNCIILTNSTDRSMSASDVSYKLYLDSKRQNCVPIRAIMYNNTVYKLSGEYSNIFLTNMGDDWYDGELEVYFGSIWDEPDED